MGLREDFETILQQSSREEDIHRFLADHPVILAGCFAGEASVKSKVSIHRHQMDFAVCQYWGSADQCQWTLVEIERPTHKLFTSKGDPTAALTHALRQIIDWRAWIEGNLAYARQLLPQINPTPAAMIIIGRRVSLKAADRQRLGILTAGLFRTYIHTYDHLLDSCHT